MESDKKIDPKQDLFVRYGEDIHKAHVRAVREAMIMHKKLGNPVVVEIDGKTVILQPEDIDVS